MKVKLRVLTPIHIGSGKQISPLEYFIHEDKFICLDMDSLFEDPAFKLKQEDFFQCSKNQRHINKILPLNLLLRHSMYAIDLSPEAKMANPIEVKSFIKSAGRVFIPGSALKGSILSGVMENILSTKNIRNLTNFDQLLSQVFSEISAHPFSNKPRYSRWLNVRDSELKSPKETLQLSLVKLVGVRSQKQMTLFYETLRENTEFETEIKTSLDSVEKWAKKTEIEILKMADQFYRKVYEKEKFYFQKQQLPGLCPDTFLLRIGQGSTAWATSFLILAEELGIKNYKIKRPSFHQTSGAPQTRKLVSGTQSMGWLEVIPDA